jgi:hypothetical protein
VGSASVQEKSAQCRGAASALNRFNDGVEVQAVADIEKLLS